MESVSKNDLFEFRILSGLDSLDYEKVDSVSLMNDNGEFCVLPDHINIISRLNSGIIKIVANNRSYEKVFISSGIMSFSNNKLHVLCDSFMQLSEDSFRLDTQLNLTDIQADFLKFINKNNIKNL